VVRPASEIRVAARRAAWEAVSQLQRAVTWRDMEARLVPTGVGRQAVKFTVKNMARSGELAPADLVRVQGSSRLLRSYMPLGHPLASNNQAGAMDAIQRALYGPIGRSSGGWMR